MNPTTVALPVVRALLDEAGRKRYTGGVLGLYARPIWDGPGEFDHRGVPVTVVTCASALATREALLAREPDRWLVLLTDRTDGELGLGITAHLIWHRLRRPDPWAAVQDRFDATRVEHRLVTAAGSRELALGLLTAAGPEGWPPAPAALLTRDHAVGSVAAIQLGLGTLGEPLDLSTTLRWSARPDAATRLADLRAVAGSRLVEALIDWVADRCGSGGAGVATLMRSGRAGDAIPAGLVARIVVATPPGSGPRALLAREVGGHLPDLVWTGWATEAELVTRDLLGADQEGAAQVLARADVLLDQVEAGDDAGASEVLQRGLTARLAELGEALRRCADRAAVLAGRPGGPDVPLADLTRMPEVEAARDRVQEHVLATHPDEVRVPRALAGVRLARWLAQPGVAELDWGALVARYRDEDAWADRAIATAWTGVENEGLARGLRAVLGAARLRRDAHDTAFGRELARRVERDTAAPSGVTYLEDLLARVVLPLAKGHPVLLIVVDGMSQAIAAEVVDDVVRRYDSWLECLPEGAQRRLAGLAPLPTVTRTCRASLLCGELTVGERQVERAGLSALGQRDGVATHLFHKIALDSSPDGYALAEPVRAAIDDVAGTPLVGCVLNTVDDALDRSDPGGTSWGADTVRHLRPLLDRARLAGRAVVLVSDHGHVIERRQGRCLPVEAGSVSSARSRAAGGAGSGSGVVSEDEIRVRGRRVLSHGGHAILAVSERLRYGQLKAGYHGGASPAEVVVPVSVLAVGEAPPGWRLAPPQSPAWWRGPVAEPAPVSPDRQVPSAPTSSPVADVLRLPLFDHPDPTPTPVSVSGGSSSGRAGGLVEAVLASAGYRRQRARATRATITDRQIRDLLGALLAAQAQRLDPESAAAALGVATVQLPGALSQAQRLLNIEQYPVLGRDPDGATVVLDVDLLQEQFEVAR